MKMILRRACLWSAAPVLACLLSFTPPDSYADSDTVHVTAARYTAASSTLTVEATGSNPAAVLTVYDAKRERPIGTLDGDGAGAYAATFAVEANPGTIAVRSSMGGSAVVEVEVQ